MSLYILRGRGQSRSKTLWTPEDAGQPNAADTKEELASEVPKPEPRACLGTGCDHFGTFYATSCSGKHWMWRTANYCYRCYALRQHHGLELADLIALWELQDGRCYQCSRRLTNPRLSATRQGPQGVDGAWAARIDHDHTICPQKKHSCDRCRRGLVCNFRNCHALAIRSTKFWVLPGDGDLRTWLEFLGPADRDRLRKALTLFPEQPVRVVSRRKRSPGESNVVPLFDVSA